MITWERLHIEIGTIKPETKHVLTFRLKEFPTDFKVEKIEVSCGCTTPNFDAEDGVLTAIFKASKIPKHLQYKNEFTTVKSIIVHSNKGKYTLTFRAKIKKDK